MQQIMTHCFLAVKSKLECKLGYFDLIGCDFLIDDNFKVTLRRSGVGGPGGQVEGGGVSVHSLTTQTGPPALWVFTRLHSSCSWGSL